MNYRKIPQAVAEKLSPLEAYVYLVLASKSDFNTMESKVNESTLAEETKLSISTIGRYIKKYTTEHIIKKITERKRGSSGAYLFNTYYLSDLHYALISMDLLKEPIRRELKGFLTQLKLRCYNFTNLCQYSVRELAETLSYSKSTVERYLQEAESLGYIKRDEKGVKLLNKELFIVDEKSEYEYIREFYPEILTDEDIRDHKIHY